LLSRKLNVRGRVVRGGGREERLSCELGEKDYLGAGCFAFKQDNESIVGIISVPFIKRKKRKTVFEEKKGRYLRGEKARKKTDRAWGGEWAQLPRVSQLKRKNVITSEIERKGKLPILAERVGGTITDVHAK